MMREHTPGGMVYGASMNDELLPGSHGIDFDDSTLADLQRRLRRIEGQVRGLQQMLSERRDCRDVVTQIAAANKALEQVGFLMVSAGLTWCLEDPHRSAAAGYDIADVQKMFLKLA
jgi:DNA-binding FrmR family transcriptional regulator